MADEEKAYNSSETELVVCGNGDHSLLEDVIVLMCGRVQCEADLLVFLNPQVNLFVFHCGVKDVLNLLVIQRTRESLEGSDEAGGERGI